MLPSDRPDAKATAIAERVARELGCSDVDDVLDALKRVLSDNADAEIHRRVLGQQSDAHRTRADAAEADRDYWREQATGMAPSVDGMRAITSLLIPGGTGCVVDPARAVAAVDALLAIVDGRAEAPTDAERAVHAGEWLVRYRDSRACRWWPLDSTGRPCAWPTGGGL